MDSILAALASILDKIEGLLSDSPARAIGYGAAVVVYIVAKVSGSIPDVSLQDALGQTAAAILLIVTTVESIRKYVYSPSTVDRIINGPID